MMATLPAVRDGLSDLLLLAEYHLGGATSGLDGGWVVELGFVDGDLADSAVLGTADSLLDESGLLLSGRLGSRLLDELVDGLLVVHLAAAVPVHPGLQGVVTRLSYLGARHLGSDILLHRREPEKKKGLRLYRYTP